MDSTDHILPQPDGENLDADAMRRAFVDTPPPDFFTNPATIDTILREAATATNGHSHASTGTDYDAMLREFSVPPPAGDATQEAGAAADTPHARSVAVFVGMLKGGDPAQVKSAHNSAARGDAAALEAEAQVDAEAENANPFDAWTPVSVTEYGQTPLPERRDLIHGLMRIHGVTVPHGMPGSLKTMLMLDAASCVATGAEWLPQVGTEGGTTFATTRVPVLWLNFDMADEDIHERAAAVHRTRPLSDGDVFDMVSLPVPWLDLSKSVFAEHLSKWIGRRGYGLVVIDNFSNVKGAAKLIDESIADVMLNVRRLSKSAECAVWIIHHETKNTAGKTAFERMYGGVHIAASVEAAFSVTRNGDRVTLAASKQRGYMSVTSFSALYTYTQNADNTLDTFKFFATANEVQDENSLSGTSPLQVSILRVLLAKPLSYQSIEDIVTELGGDQSPNSVRNAVAKMHKKGLVERRNVGKVAMYCAAPLDRQEAGVTNWTENDKE